jgi:hypothetical protein
MNQKRLKKQKQRFGHFSFFTIYFSVGAYHYERLKEPEWLRDVFVVREISQKKTFSPSPLPQLQ